MWTIYLLVLTVFTSTDTTYLLSTRVFVLFIWFIFLNTVRRRRFLGSRCIEVCYLKSVDVCVCGISDSNHPRSRWTWLATTLASYPFLHCTRLFEIDSGVWNDNSSARSGSLLIHVTSRSNRIGHGTFKDQEGWVCCFHYNDGVWWNKSWNDGWVWCHCKAKKCIINTYIYINIYIYIYNAFFELHQKQDLTDTWSVLLF